MLQNLAVTVERHIVVVFFTMLRIFMMCTAILLEEFELFMTVREGDKHETNICFVMCNGGRIIYTVHKEK